MELTEQGASRAGGIVPVTAPTEQEIARILGLKKKCEFRLGISIVLGGDFLRSLDNPRVGAFAFLSGQDLVGFAFFYSFEKEEAETCFFADPDADWGNVENALLEATKKECRRRACDRLLVMYARRSVPGKELIERTGGSLCFSEHRLESAGAPPLPRKEVQLRRVGDDDATLREIELACHGRFYPKPDQARYVALSEGEPVGKIDVCLDGPDAELTGFCVLPQLRGQGLGKAILLHTVRMLRDERKGIITLDVQTDNEVALSLYLSSGFQERFTIDYYALCLEDMISDESHPGE